MIDDYLHFLNEQELLYEEVLYHVAESRWKRLLAAGKLTKKQLRRIQKYKGAPDPLYVKQLLKQRKFKQADEYIKKRGIVKSARAWIAGVEKGTQNILKHYKAKVLHKPSAGYAKAMAGQFGLKPGKTMRKWKGAHATLSFGGGRRRAHLPTGLKKKEQTLGAIVKRHEADEIRAGVSQLKSKHARGFIAKPGGSHISREVVRREKELVNTAKQLYGDKGPLKTLQKIRKFGGEYKHLPSKNVIKKEERKLRKKIIDDIRNTRKELKELPPDMRKDAFKQIQSDLMLAAPKKDAIKILRMLGWRGK